MFSFFVQSQTISNDTFEVRGALPWHNFLSGPTTWNRQEYAQYIDWMHDNKLNLLVLRTYTGGLHRYSNYVEPIVKMEYRKVLPQASLDTSLTSRWGYRPMKTNDYVFDTDKLFVPHSLSGAFGSEVATLPKTSFEQYEYSKALIRDVIDMAHLKGIKVALGFEFGVYPPELFSIAPIDSYMENMLPDPSHPASREILYYTLDDIISSYPKLDQVWLWMQENEIRITSGIISNEMNKLLTNYGSLFISKDKDQVFRGVWSLEFIKLAYSYLKSKSPNIQVVVSGWGGENQLMGIMQGLDKGLPKEIVLPSLNPNFGQQSQPNFFKEIANYREVWLLPWLEGDYQLWHPQERVYLLQNQINLAKSQGLKGAIAVHWRTKDIKANMEAFALFASLPPSKSDVPEFYSKFLFKEYGTSVGSKLVPIFIKIDKDTYFTSLTSPEYLPYDPTWGRLIPHVKKIYQDIFNITQDGIKENNDNAILDNLKWLNAVAAYVLTLDEVSSNMEPAYLLKQKVYSSPFTKLNISIEEFNQAINNLNDAPIEKLFRTYANRVKSRGELGVLSSMNQKLWLEFSELKNFLNALNIK